MNEMKNSQTFRNLLKAFENESSQSHAYLFYSIIAKIEGYDYAVDFLENLAEYGVNNSHGSLDYIRTVSDPFNDIPIGETKNNFQAITISLEKEANDMYQSFAYIAHREEFHDIASWFETLAKFKLAYLEKSKKILEKIMETVQKDE